MYIHRILTAKLEAALARGKSVLLLGARQTGKTTLISHLKTDYTISFAQPRVRQSYEIDPGRLTLEIEALAENSSRTPLIVMDEVQKVPAIMDAVQDLIDRRLGQFILTGSSARKLRARSVNWLPGRVVLCRLDPFVLTEMSPLKFSLEDLLLYGSLPGIVTDKTSDEKELDLDSYVSTYLEEEVRAEALVRNTGPFSQFLTLAASESGNIVNFSKLSQEIGVSHTTIASYYQILEDCLIAEKIEPLTQSKTRKKLTKTPKYLFFDLGLRRVTAKEGRQLPENYWGRLLEQWVGLELIRNARFSLEPSKIYFWRDLDGPEVDWIIAKNDYFIPLEVKWTERPQLKDIKHLTLFCEEYKNTPRGYLICRVPKKQKLTANIYAIPWQDLNNIDLTN